MQTRLSVDTHRDLLIALESARTRLAVAMAVEYKSTPPARWRYYLATADRMTAVVRRLRASGGEIQCKEWSPGDVVAILKSVGADNNPARICRIFGKIADEME
ncbi:MAG TPA: hypothetical protein VLL97_07825 [Acidobacteriota bacterium]|nr:hypothetical protein [Acidobacteriota bacterium]